MINRYCEKTPKYNLNKEGYLVPAELPKALNLNSNQVMFIWS